MRGVRGVRVASRGALVRQDVLGYQKHVNSHYL